MSEIVQQPYYAATVTVTTTAQNLDALLKAAFAAQTPLIPFPNNPCATELMLQIAPDAAGDPQVFIGMPSATSAVNYGYALVGAGANRRYGPFNIPSLPLSNMYLIGNGTIKVSVELVVT